MRSLVTAAAVLMLTGLCTSPARADSPDKDDVEELTASAEARCDAFKKLVKDELDDSIVQGTRIQSSIEDAVDKLDEAIEKLKKKLAHEDDFPLSREEARAVWHATRGVKAALEDITRKSDIWERWKPLEERLEKIADAYELKR